MKKKLYLFICLFLLTGCNVNYKVEFTNGNFKEDVYLFTNNNTFIEKTETDEGKKEMATQMYLWDKDYNNYERKLKFDENTAGFNYHTEFNRKENTWKSIVNQCYENIKITNEKDFITIQTSNEFLCYDKFYELENVNISFKTNYIVTESNADFIKNNRYIWNIKMEDANNKPLYIKMKNKEIASKKSKENIIPIVLIGSTIIIIITTIIFVNKRKKNNDF